MFISIDGQEYDWMQINPNEANHYKFLQRQLEAFDQQVKADRQILIDQLAHCVTRTREQFNRR